MCCRGTQLLPCPAVSVGGLLHYRSSGLRFTFLRNLAKPCPFTTSYFQLVLCGRAECCWGTTYSSRKSLYKCVAGAGGWRMAGPSGFVVESLYQPVGGLRLSLRGGLGVLVFGCCGWYAGGSPIRPTVPVLSLHPSARTRAGGPTRADPFWLC